MLKAKPKKILGRRKNGGLIIAKIRRHIASGNAPICAVPNTLVETTLASPDCNGKKTRKKKCSFLHSIAKSPGDFFIKLFMQKPARPP